MVGVFLEVTVSLQTFQKKSHAHHTTYAWKLSGMWGGRAFEFTVSTSMDTISKTTPSTITFPGGNAISGKRVGVSVEVTVSASANRRIFLVTVS